TDPEQLDEPREGRARELDAPREREGLGLGRRASELDGALGRLAVERAQMRVRLEHVVREREGAHDLHELRDALVALARRHERAGAEVTFASRVVEAALGVALGVAEE